ncbi:hypothetical protein MKW98_018948 [Papaver atlanticum]|uniref:Uncharacterized protein n=1 Tax=Papaver atlanticum TaxID=357466 RepID=A0AAD4TJ32_9MAGN|nr:hypothetical protein MKW98_018948 [Papaver atlanticum]
MISRDLYSRSRIIRKQDTVKKSPKEREFDTVAHQISQADLQMETNDNDHCVGFCIFIGEYSVKGSLNRVMELKNCSSAMQGPFGMEME